MLRLTGLRSVSIRAFHTSEPALAAKKSSKVKAIAQGFKKGGQGKKSKKQAGSFRFFQDQVHAGKYYTKGAELESVGKLEGELTLGQVVKYTEEQLKNTLAKSGAFKKDQFNELFKTPISLIRKETKEIEEFLSNASETSSIDNRICLIGDRGIGKSTLLAQAQAILTNKGDSIILPIPYALQLVNGTNDYIFDRSVGSYAQPMYLKKFLNKILKVNATQLKELKLSKEYQIESHYKNRQPLKFNSESTLFDLLDSRPSSRQRAIIFQILIHELSLQENKSVFFIVDNFSAITSNSRTEYRHPDTKPIKVDELQISKTLLEFTSGEKSFKKGGIILATSSDDKPSITLSAGLDLVKPDAYTKSLVFDRAISAKLHGVKPFHVGKLSKENVGTLVETLIEANAFTQSELESIPKEELINNRYVLSGNGNPLELFRSVALYY